MNLTVKQISELVKGKITGNEAVVITGVAGINEAGPSDISFLKKELSQNGTRTTKGAVRTSPFC